MLRSVFSLNGTKSRLENCGLCKNWNLLACYTHTFLHKQKPEDHSILRLGKKRRLPLFAVRTLQLFSLLIRSLES